ncbi:GFA family protein [Phaeobacter sp. 11ANDIMAR09]|uniref:GFA family protein n=1 Tax=Phaeobacter sp. 11ANDIMAR09 TaxID=1225647 RepID=UPI0006C8DD7E|nr:GFA family protein [Phaeobacter sp. 11ANDIMAR09]KPD12186.1 aldehyde-activating protein [Phaeobacter sp. 11ANDIMAR09]
MSELHGHCMCGAVTVSMTPARHSLGACHCDMCRRWTSSMLMTLPASPGYAALGPVKTYVSSDWAERAFCSECGSALWYRITAPGKMHGQTQMAAGLFDNAGESTLSLELYIDKKPEGYAFAGPQRKMTEADVMAAFRPSAEGDNQ